MRLYLCSSYRFRAMLMDWRSDLTRIGFLVQSRWLDIPPEQSFGEVDAAGARRLARMDSEDLSSSDALVTYADPRYGRGGRHVEFGMALALSLPIFAVGQREHVFHHLVPEECWFATWPECLASLANRDEPPERRAG